MLGGGAGVGGEQGERCAGEGEGGQRGAGGDAQQGAQAGFDGRGGGGQVGRVTGVAMACRSAGSSSSQAPCFSSTATQSSQCSPVVSATRRRITAPLPLTRLRASRGQPAAPHTASKLMTLKRSCSGR